MARMTRVAAIDCGTNSIRLLIADISGPMTVHDVQREMRVVRLGQGVDATGEFSSEALERTFAAVDEYAELIQREGAERIRFAATSASRDARNRDQFITGIRDRLGVEPEVISGTEEAELSFTGAASGLPQVEPGTALVIDLGGGSTEFVLGEIRSGAQIQSQSVAPRLIASRSVNLGCVRFTERYLTSDPPTEPELLAAVADIRAVMAEVAAQIPLARAQQVIGVAGTVTTVTAHALGLTSYLPERMHGAEVAIPELIRASDELTVMSRAERSSLGFMHPGRVDVIGAGALIWRTILAELSELSGGRIQAAVTSEHDILDGLALSLA